MKDDAAAPAAEKPGPHREFRSGFVAVVGRPNVGKSTLVNRLTGCKVSIVSDKPQTTRNRVAGVVTTSSAQVVLLDVPGFQKPRDELTKRMQAVVDQTLEEVDGALFVVACNEAIGKGDAFIASRLTASGVPTIVLLNKVDLADEAQVTRQTAKVTALGIPAPVFPVSAVTGHGLGEVLSLLEQMLPPGPLYFPEGTVTDRPDEWLIGELIREKVLHVTEDEVPHSVSVEVREVEEREGAHLIDVSAAIYVERESQRPIILGEGGSRLKRIGTEARRDIEALLGTHVFLDLVVQVRPHWRRNPGLLDRLGL